MSLEVYLLRKHLLVYMFVIISLVSLISGCFGGGGSIPGAYTVSGFVRDSEGRGIEGAILDFSQGFGTATTNDMGEWSKNGLSGSVTITPAKAGYAFTPGSLKISGPSNSVNFIGSSDAIAKGRLKVSFIGNSQPRVKSQVTMGDLTPFEQSIYVAPFNSDLKGNLVGRYTPHSVIGSVNGMGVASPNYRLPLNLRYGVATGPYSGFGLLPIFDLALAKDIVYVDYLVEHGRNDFTVVELQIWGENMPGCNINFSQVSEVHVDLGTEYQGITFPKELKDKSYGTVHVFQLVDLIPLGKKDHIALVRLAFDHSVDRPYIVNPDGSYVHDLNPYFWECDTRMGIAGYVIYLPGLNLDLSSQSAHLIFDWDLFNLIEVYDNGTPDDPSDDLITLCLENPFPVTLRAEPYSEWEPIVGDGVQPPEVSELDIRFYDLVNQQIFLRWLNPSVADFRQVNVVRKEGTPPMGLEDGEVVYVGNGAMYQDDNISLGKEYFYRVIVEDWDGLFSNGEVIGIRTDSWELTEMELHAYPESVSVGDMIYLDAYGYTKQGERVNALSQWELVGDIGGISYEFKNYMSQLDDPGCSCIFQATKPGTGVVVARQGELSARRTITVTE
jgi:hypothetical protein